MQVMIRVGFSSCAQCTDRGANMNDSQEKMTYQEWEEAHDASSQAAYSDQMIFLQASAPIEADLDAALGAYMAALDDPEAKAAALERFDAALIRLREVYRECEYQWDKYVKDPCLFRAMF
jgi:hypothetical protein